MNLLVCTHARDFTHPHVCVLLIAYTFVFVRCLNVLHVDNMEYVYADEQL